MIKAIKDNVCNEESQNLFRAIQNQPCELEGEVEIHENPASGWIYAADGNSRCYLFNGCKTGTVKEIEEHISCSNCGGEGFISAFLDENKDECCKEYFKDCGHG